MCSDLCYLHLLYSFLITQKINGGWFGWTGKHLRHLKRAALIFTACSGTNRINLVIRSGKMVDNFSTIVSNEHTHLRKTNGRAFGHCHNFGLTLNGPITPEESGLEEVKSIRREPSQAMESKKSRTNCIFLSTDLKRHGRSSKPDKTRGMLPCRVCGYD